MDKGLRTLFTAIGAIVVIVLGRQASGPV